MSPFWCHSGTSSQHSQSNFFIFFFKYCYGRLKMAINPLPCHSSSVGGLFPLLWSGLWHVLTNHILHNCRDLQLPFSPLGTLLLKTQTPWCEEIWAALCKGPPEEDRDPWPAAITELPNGRSTTCQPCEWGCSSVLQLYSTFPSQCYLKQSQAIPVKSWAGSWANIWPLL